MTIQSDCPPITYSKVYLPTCSTFKGLNVELISSTNGLTLYLNALTFTFQESASPGFTQVFVSIDGDTFSGQAVRLEGGQKLILPEEMQEVIVTALLDQKNIVITTGRYQEELISDNFDKAYSILVKQFNKT